MNEWGRKYALLNNQTEIRIEIKMAIENHTHTITVKNQKHSKHARTSACSPCKNRRQNIRRHGERERERERERKKIQIDGNIYVFTCILSACVSFSLPSRIVFLPAHVCHSWFFHILASCIVVSFLSSSRFRVEPTCAPQYHNAESIFANFSESNNTNSKSLWIVEFI